MLRIGLAELGWPYYLPVLILVLGFTALVAYNLGYDIGYRASWHRGWGKGWDAGAKRLHLMDREEIIEQATVMAVAPEMLEVLEGLLCNVITRDGLLQIPCTSEQVRAARAIVARAERQDG